MHENWNFSVGFQNHTPSGPGWDNFQIPLSDTSISQPSIPSVREEVLKKEKIAIRRRIQS